MGIWESSLELCAWSSTVPEVTGSEKEIIGGSILPVQGEHIPMPRCKAVGYTALEWIRHWVQQLPDTVLRAPAEEYRQECLRALRQCLDPDKKIPASA